MVSVNRDDSVIQDFDAFSLRTFGRKPGGGWMSVDSHVSCVFSLGNVYTVNDKNLFLMSGLF